MRALTLLSDLFVTYSFISGLIYYIYLVFHFVYQPYQANIECMMAEEMLYRLIDTNADKFKDFLRLLKDIVSQDDDLRPIKKN